MAVSSSIPSSCTSSSEAPTLMLPPSGAHTPMVHKSTQSELSSRHVEELESRASSDIESKNNRIDNLQCVSEPLNFFFVFYIGLHCLMFIDA